MDQLLNPFPLSSVFTDDDVDALKKWAAGDP